MGIHHAAIALAVDRDRRLGDDHGARTTKARDRRSIMHWATIGVSYETAAATETAHVYPVLHRDRPAQAVQS